MPPEPFRDDEHAALARVSSLEDENAQLRARLREKLEPPTAETRNMPLWLLALFVIVPVMLLGAGLAAAFLLRNHAPAPDEQPAVRVSPP
jgi:hypothetical protein